MRLNLLFDTFVEEFISKRYIVTFFLFLGVTLFAAIAGTFNVAVVAMNESGDFNWTSTEKGVILSALYYGFIVTQIPGGLLVRIWPANIIFGVGIVGACLLTCFTPFVASNFYLLIMFKVMEGLLLGSMYPAMITLVRNWTPISEQTRVMMIVGAGNYIGPVIFMPLAGFLSDLYGWQHVFYTVGILGIIWFIFYVFIVKESPEKNTFMSENEIKYIESERASYILDGSYPIPWKSILTSVPFLAIIIANFTLSWGLYTITTQLPTYLIDMNPELAFKMTGFYAMLPALTMGLLSPIAGRIVDYLINNQNFLTRLQVRKYFTCVAFILQSIFLLLTAFIMKSHATIAFLSISEGLSAFALSGFGVNYLDIGPQFCGLLLGISITIGTMAGIASPILAGIIVQNKDASEWQIVFFIASGIYLVGSILYWFMASGELQSWAKKDENIEQKNNENHVDVEP